MRLFYNCFMGLLAAGMLMTSCNSNPDKFHAIDIFKEFSPPVALEPDKEYEITLGEPIKFLVVDSLLFSLETKQDQFIRCTNLNTEEEIAFFLNKGRGPAELTHCLSMRTYPGDSIQVYGNPPGIMQFAVKDVLDGIKPSDYRKFPIQGQFHIRPNAVRIDEDRAIFPGTPLDQTSDKLFYLYDLGTKDYQGFGTYNPYFFQDMDLLPTQKSIVAQYFIEPHPDKNRIVAATVNFKSLEVYDLQSKELVASRYYELPKVDIRKENGFTFTFSSEEQRGFSCICCNEEAIYCFYIKPEDMEKQHINKPVYIFKYDWQLEPLGCYVIEACKPYGFVSADNRYVFASKIDIEKNEYIFCRYEI